MRGGSESLDSRVRQLEQLVKMLTQELRTSRDTIAKLRIGRGELLVETQGSISVGATGTCTVLEYDANADDDIDSGEELTARLKIGEAITAAGTRGIVRWFPGWNEWWFVATECG